MNKEEIKEILDNLKPNYDIVDEFGNDYKKIKFKECKLLLDYITNLQNQLEEKTYLYNKLDIESKYVITNLQEENERLKEQNNELRRIYRNTYNRLFEKGNDELARYFQAQIDDCPTFYIEPIIDYYKECKDYKSRLNKAIEYINKTTNDTMFELRSDTGELNYLMRILKGEE